MLSIKSTILPMYLITVGLFTLLRFINIESDFPDQYIDGGFVMTDEGWYCNGAVSKIVTGKWVGYGFKNMLVIPTNHIIQFVAMSIFGVSATTSRSVIAFMFILFIIALFLICKNIYGYYPAVIALIPVVTSPWLFAYSRISLLEIEVLAFVSWAIAALIYKKRALAILLMIIALLTKPTAAFAIIPLIYLSSQQESIKTSIIIFISIFLGYAFYLIIVYLYDPMTIKDFFFYNIEERVNISFLHVFEKMVYLDFVLFTSAIIVFPMITPIKKSIFPIMLFIMILIPIIFNGYQPNRYFLFFALPLCLIVAAGISGTKNPNRHIMVIITLALFINSPAIYSIMTDARYSMKNFCELFRNKDNITGTMANTISLFSGIKSSDTSNCFIAYGRDVQDIKDIRLDGQIYETNVYKSKVYILYKR